MKTSWKHVLCLALVGLLFFTCPLGAVASTQESYPSQSGKTFDFGGETIVVYSREGEQSNALKAQIPEFERRYNAKVELALFPNDILITKIMTALASGSSEYDVLMLTFDASYIENAWVEPLDQWINDPDVADAGLDMADFIPALLQPCTGDDGKLYAFPFKPDAMVYYYRTDLLNDPKEQAAFKEKYGYDLAPAKTWEQYTDIANFFTRPDQGLYGSIVMAAAENQLFNAANARFLGTGGRLLDENYMPQVNTPGFLKALDELVYEVNNTANPACTNWAYADANTEWLAGRAAQHCSWPGVAKISEQANGATGNSQIVGKVGYATMPGFEDGAPASVMGGWNVWVSAFSQKKLEAYKFIEFTVSKDGDLLKQPEGCDSARQSSSAIFAEKDPFYDALAANFAIAVPTPRVTGWDAYQQIMRTEVHAAVTNMKSSAEAAAAIEEQWLALLSGDGYVK